MNNIKVKKQTKIEWNIPNLGLITVELDNEQNTTVMFYDKRYTTLPIHLEGDLKTVQATLELVKRAIDKTIETRRDNASSTIES